MLGDPFRRVRAGEPLKIPAPAWNAAMDAARFVMEHQADQSVGPALAPGAGAVLIQNKTGAALDALSVVGLGEPIFFSASDADILATFQKQVGFEGNTPDADTDAGRFAVLLAPLAADGIGPAMIDGVCPVRVNVADEEDGYAEVADGDATQLESGRAGSAQILWAESGTGTKWAVVRLGGIPAQRTVFPVTLTQAGGSDGTSSAKASWTYNVADALTGDSLASAADPTASPHLHQRPAVGSMIRATSGLAYYKADGTLVLAFVNEVADQSACA
jgi:hypothetical protein